MILFTVFIFIVMCIVFIIHRNLCIVLKVVDDIYDSVEEIEETNGEKNGKKDDSEDKSDDTWVESEYL